MLIKETWKLEPTYAKITKYVPLKWLLQFKGNNLRKTEEEMHELFLNIRANGLEHPLWMGVGKENKKIHLGEGNHRLEIFRRHNVKEVPLIIGLQNNVYQGSGLPPYDYPFLKDLTNVERGLRHPDKIFSEYIIL